MVENTGARRKWIYLLATCLNTSFEFIYFLSLYRNSIESFLNMSYLRQPLADSLILLVMFIVYISLCVNSDDREFNLSKLVFP